MRSGSNSSNKGRLRDTNRAVQQGVQAVLDTGAGTLDGGGVANSARRVAFLQVALVLVLRVLLASLGMVGGRRRSRGRCSRRRRSALLCEVGKRREGMGCWLVGGKGEDAFFDFFFFFFSP